MSDDDNAIVWTCKHFNELTLHELYAIIELRNEVFVVEQQCVFQDADNKDQQAHHVTGFNTKTSELVAYARLLNAGVTFDHPAIGRVITKPSARSKGLGKELLRKCIAHCELLFPDDPTIEIGAQLYLQKFYESFGFEKSGDVYDEDGILHIHMIRQYR